MLPAQGEIVRGGAHVHGENEGGGQGRQDSGTRQPGGK